ncbi:TonB-linked outer membrane protein, SusC/RagA family [Algoriphagus locisalis]|uniref:TonB-linked outer membrane protein, SusC/RagA family n=1 Tax=Algoriphagus locisalis TaxID=305507 RepID=A0A1I7DFS3_9BACT|nr:TonB-dependent receptor [Algoriphagus locisalis]SFU10445.1 TonB-linked outer membrane protein, SusC/RagA family [Algoriphagus locisalis]
MCKTIYPKSRALPPWKILHGFVLSLFLFLIASGSTFAQSKTVSGVIKSSTGETMPGVNVLVKGTTIGTASDIDGNFSLTVPSDESILVFSFIGYTSREVRVGNSSELNVTLDEDLSQLSEVVVVGYGTQERAKVTGAISSVGSEQIRALPVPSLASALQGRAAGVNVTNSGSPGTNPIVRIRGVGTVGNNEPLYVIDGMPAGGLNQINPADIESIEVLKDASTAAIYGSRGANGVILVTTKKGKIGKPVVSLDAYYGVQNAWKTLNLLNRDQYIAFGRDLLGNAGEDAPARFDNLGEFANNDIDYQDEMFQSAPIQDYNLNVAGGTENALYNFSVGYFAQDGIMRGTGFERVSMRSNTEFKINDRIKIGQTLTVAYSDRQNEPFSGGRSQLEHIVKSIPYIPVRDASRLGGFRASDRVDGSDPENPVLNAELRRNNVEDYKILGSGYVTVNILKGLDYKFLVGMDIGLGNTFDYTPSFNAGDFSVQPFAAISQTRSTFVSPLISNQFTYTTDFGKHHLDALGVIERQTSTFSSLTGSGQNSLTNEVKELQGVENQTTSSTRTEYGLISYVGRVNYDYAQKYLISASIRRDGGSRFGPDNKWGTFPSLSVGWRVSEEGFMQGVEAVSDLKLRASYGETGNDRIGDYVYQATINSNLFYNFDDNLLTGSTISALANADLKWETTIMKNIGLDLGLFNDQFNLSLEWFENTTEDMILGVPIPPSLGFDGAPVANVGTVKNTGLEITAGYQLRSGDFQMSIDGNMGFVNNELVSLGTGNTIFGPAFQGDAMTLTEEGQPIAYFLGWIADGIFQTNEEAQAAPRQILPDDPAEYDPTTHTAAGDIRFRDINNDGVIDANDRTNLGHYLPDFTYGLNANASYKGFDFTMFWQGVSGNEIFNNLRYHTEGMTRLFGASDVVLDRWTPSNTNTDVPRAISGDPNRNARASSRFVEDGSYLRLKNISVGYSIPSSLLNTWSKGNISKVRVYLSAQNLLTITDYSGYDPEVAARTGINSSLGTGIDYGQFPAARTIMGGIQLSF